MDNDKVTISREFFNELIADANFLDELHAGGVDNWVGYDDARQRMKDNEVEDDG